MNHSIMNMLNQHRYNPIDVEDEIVKKIDTLLENPYLGVELCDSELVWKRKSNGYKYNMKLTLFTKPNGFLIDEERFVILRNPLELSFIYNVLFDFVNRENIKFE